MNKNGPELLDFFIEGTEAGCDEAGRGCLAGPVVAASVILDPNNPVNGLNDSKLLSANKRDHLKDEIISKALAWSVGTVNNEEIDQINIYRATMKAFHLAINNLGIVPDHLIVDGNMFIPYKKIPFKCIVKGDAKYKSIAAASIIAKTYRDNIMLSLHNEFTCYNWFSNKGYATLAHRQAILTHGISKYHRKSFALYDRQLKLDL